MKADDVIKIYLHQVDKRVGVVLSALVSIALIRGSTAIIPKPCVCKNFH